MKRITCIRRIIYILHEKIFHSSQKNELKIYKENIVADCRSHWPNVSIDFEELIREQWELKNETGSQQSIDTSQCINYIVFIDKELSIDWIASPPPSDDETCRLISQASAIEALPCMHLDKSQVLAFKRLIGEA